LTRRVTFRQSDVTRAVQAVKDGGEKVASVKIDPDGTIHVLTAGDHEKPLDPFEVWERGHGGRAA
jgi:hypothetical protein